MRRKRKSRDGMSLLELIIASTVMTILMTSIGVLLRSSRRAWEVHSNDYVRVESGHATLRHIVREVRQAKSVTALSLSSDNSGKLTVEMENGDTKSWNHNANAVYFGVNVGGTPTDLLADNITGLRITGYRANGLTLTATPDQVQCLLVEVTVTFPREANSDQTMRSWVWVRSW